MLYTWNYYNVTCPLYLSGLERIHAGDGRPVHNLDKCCRRMRRIGRGVAWDTGGTRQKLFVNSGLQAGWLVGIWLSWLPQLPGSEGNMHGIHSVLLGIRVSINTPGLNSWLYQLLAVPLMGHFISWGSAFFIYGWTRWHYCFSKLTGRFNKLIYYLSCRWHINGQIHFCFSFPLSDLAELSSFWNSSSRGSIHEVTHF